MYLYLLFFLFAIGSSPGCEAGLDKKDRENLASAGKLHAGGEIWQALKIYEAVIAKTGHENAYIMAGKCRYMAKEFDKAEIHFQKALKKNPHNLNGLFWLGKIHVIRAGLKEAEKLFSRVLELDSMHLGARIERAKIYKAQNRYLEAFREFNSALKIANLALNAHLELGDLYLKSGTPTKAEEHFNKILRDAPNNDLIRGKIKDIKMKWTAAQKKP